MERTEEANRAHQTVMGGDVRRWAIEQVMGALTEGNRASSTDIVKMADVLATYVLTGKVST